MSGSDGKKLVWGVIEDIFFNDAKNNADIGL